MKFTKTTIPDVIIVEPKTYGDDRGFFMETYQANRFAEVGISHSFIQDNHSKSCQGVLRGLHYQIRQPQGKLVRVVSGEIYDVAVDLRRSSVSFGQWVGIHLSAQNKLQLWIPPGFGHGFYVLSEWAEVTYKATDLYTPEWERSIRWDDPILNIDWSLGKEQHPIVSNKDAQGKLFVEADLFD